MEKTPSVAVDVSLKEYMKLKKELILLIALAFTFWQSRANCEEKSVFLFPILCCDGLDGIYMELGCTFTFDEIRPVPSRTSLIDFKDGRIVDRDGKKYGVSIDEFIVLVKKHTENSFVLEISVGDGWLTDYEKTSEYMREMLKKLKAAGIERVKISISPKNNSGLEYIIYDSNTDKTPIPFNNPKVIIANYYPDKGFDIKNNPDKSLKLSGLSKEKFLEYLNARKPEYIDIKSFAGGTGDGVISDENLKYIAAVAPLLSANGAKQIIVRNGEGLYTAEWGYPTLNEDFLKLKSAFNSKK